ncbi:MarR family winged helix-turn-helix transcriptional regulator [Kitasatospora sp. NBC_01539]|uniref:MarR family winged helix-turn-helix transcriptional regulator n=1 Tax=Kitasatospora sp. NBC_01539 TaxID=2903577 RepID=UPI003860223D
MTATSPDDSGDDRLALSFSQHVVRLESLLEQAITPALTAQGLTAAELDVLGALRSAGSPYQLRPKELTARLLLTTGGLSNVLRRLDTRGLVTRVPDPADGRSHNVRLTPAGVATAQAATAQAATALRRVLSAVPAATLEDALHHLQSILGAVEDAPPASPASGTSRGLGYP